MVVEWKVEMTFRQGAVIGPYTLANPFTVHLRGVNVFEFSPNCNLIAALWVYHETTTIVPVQWRVRRHGGASSRNY